MEVVGVVASAASIFEITAAAIRQMPQGSRTISQFHYMKTRLSQTEDLFKEVVRSWELSPPTNLDLSTLEDQFRVVAGRLSLVTDSGIGTMRKAIRLLTISDAEPILNDLELTVTRLHRATLQRQVFQLQTTTQSMHEIIQIIGAIFERKTNNSDENSADEKPNIEVFTARLHEALAAASSAREFKDNAFCFPFVALPDQSDDALEPARGQVKIDTGADDNWISAQFLERASVAFNLDNSLDTFKGANGDQFKPLGRVSVTWYSTNQALTHKDIFLVGGNSPFDAILGSDWVLEHGLNKFNQPVLPFRLVIDKVMSKDLRKRQVETGANNQSVIDLQKAEGRNQRKEQREREAKSRAASRMTSPAASPAVLTRRNSSTSLSRSLSPSFATSLSNAGPSTPGTIASTMGTTVSASGVTSIPVLGKTQSEPQVPGVGSSSQPEPL